MVADLAESEPDKIKIHSQKPKSNASASKHIWMVFPTQRQTCKSVCTKPQQSILLHPAQSLLLHLPRPLPPLPHRGLGALLRGVQLARLCEGQEERVQEAEVVVSPEGVLELLEQVSIREVG